MSTESPSAEPDPTVAASASLHPDVAGWFHDEVGRPTAPQAAAWPAVDRGDDVLLAAPTGTGKTFAGFLQAIDGLYRRARTGDLDERLDTLYVSPLRALTHDVARNLEPALEAMNRRLADDGLEGRLRAGGRTGDTPAAERQRQRRRPPHILVTTPESLWLLLGSEGGRHVLATTRTVILDEIHAIAPDKRGCHLALSLERLDHLVSASGGVRPQRIGLSATQRPLALLARYLGGRDSEGRPRPVTVLDLGHLRPIEVQVSVPSPIALGAVATLEQWEHFHEHVAELSREHRTTLVFVNTRRQAERSAHRLAALLGEDRVAAHHGSLARERRLAVEAAFKAEELSVLVATASMELGIDVGSVDLVVQIGGVRSVSTLLQRVGRAGHRIDRLPRGRILPTTRDELVLAGALVAAVQDGELDPIRLREHPIDVLAQHLVAIAGASEKPIARDQLLADVRRAEVFHDLAEETFDEVLAMLVEGFETPRGTVGRWLRLAHGPAELESSVDRDAPNGAAPELGPSRGAFAESARSYRARRGARLVALLSGSAIPEMGEYRVRLEESDRTVGTVHEDWAVESLPGDVFLLGAQSYQVVRIERGAVKARPAPGMAPNVPFWRGEAPGRTRELSALVGAFRQEVLERARLEEGAVVASWLAEHAGVPANGATQLVSYLQAQFTSVGACPTHDHLLVERFFDDSGGMQLCVHAPLGAAINRAFALLLRKRMCRSFNQELQAAATDEGFLLSLTDAQTLRLEDLPGFLRTAGMRDDLEQAVLGAPFFATRWRWNAMASLAVPRRSGGRTLPFELLRTRADDLLAACFPDQAACQEHLAGPVEIPDHPLVRQTLRDCLEEATDLAGLERVLEGIAGGAIRLRCVDTTAPSPFAEELVGARPWAFLDDAPLEERRSRQVPRGPALAEIAGHLGALDPAAVQEVAVSLHPVVRDLDDLVDVFEALGRCPARALDAYGPGLLSGCAEHGSLGVADGRIDLRDEVWTHHEWGARPGAGELDRVVRARASLRVSLTVEVIVRELACDPRDAEATLRRLESRGILIPVRVRPEIDAEQWVDRAVLARIHRRTRELGRAGAVAVEPRVWTRWLMQWQGLSARHRVQGPDAIARLLERLSWHEAPAIDWERGILSARCTRWDGAWLDAVTSDGRIAWGRLRTSGSGSGRATPLAFWPRSRTRLRDLLAQEMAGGATPTALRGPATTVADHLRSRGASHPDEVLRATRLLPAEFEEAIQELVGAGGLTADGFELARRALGLGTRRRPGTSTRRRLRGRGSLGQPAVARPGGRLEALRRPPEMDDQAATTEELEEFALSMLQRYGVWFAELHRFSSPGIAWGRMRRTLAVLELRGLVRGGTFVLGFEGEQFALEEAVRGLRVTAADDAPRERVVIPTSDPMNLGGLLPGTERIAARPGHVLSLEDGWPIDDGTESTGGRQEGDRKSGDPCSE